MNDKDDEHLGFAGFLALLMIALLATFTFLFNLINWID